MKTVYLLSGVSDPTKRYIGLATDLEARLRDHNSGKAIHTSKWRHWRVVAAIQFEDDQRAVEFERYLKTGSGRAFANRHLW